MIDMSPYKQAFIEEERQAMHSARSAIERLSAVPGDKALQYEVMRFFHSVHSACALMGLPAVADRCGLIEQSLKIMMETKETVTSVMIEEAMETSKAVDTALDRMEKIC